MNSEMLMGLVICGGVFAILYLVSVRLSNASAARRYGQGQHSITIEDTNGRTWQEESPDPGLIQTWRDEACASPGVRRVRIVYANGEQEETRYERQAGEVSRGVQERTNR